MDKLKSTICFSCCFRGSDVDPLAHQTPATAPGSSASASMIRASSTWIRSRASELPERCGAIVSRFGKNAHQQHQQQRRRHHHGSADFRYDPLSYALNFDDGPDFDEEADGEPASPSQYRYRSFSSRLPQSPPMPPVRAVPAGEVACS